MTETNPNSPEAAPPPAEDPSADVADTQAPVHIEERGVDEGLERALIDNTDYDGNGRP